MPTIGTPLGERRLNCSGNSPSLAAASGISAQIIVQPFSAPKPEMITTIAMTLPAQVPPNIALTASENGAVAPCKLRGREDAEHGDEREHVDDRGGERAEDRGLRDVAVGVLHLGGRDGGDLDAEVAEQRDGHAAADRADGAFAAHVPRRVVRAVDEEEADGRHERERGELEDRRPHLDRSHVLDAGEVDRGGDPQTDQHEQDREQPVVSGVDELLDVEHPADCDRGVAGPGSDPVRPRVREAEPVAERDP